MKRIADVFFFMVAAAVLLSCSKDRAPRIEGMVYIPPGEFIMGSEEVDTEGLGKEFGLRKERYYEDETPMRRVFLEGYYIDTYEVTNAQYKKYLDETGYTPPPTWENGTFPDGEADHPVTYVTWYEAHAYCKWAGKRLPTEAEWEKAARGPDGNIYPWGNEYDEKKANLNTGEVKPVGSYPTDRSPYGVYDMAGNVMEWVEDWYEPYPGNTSKNKDFGRKYKVLRGGLGGMSGHYIMNKIFARGANRNYYLPDGAGDDGGFRCARSAEVEPKR